MRNYILTIGLLLTTGLLIVGQNNFSLSTGSLKIEGTSSVHDWVYTTNNIKVNGKIEAEGTELKK